MLESKNNKYNFNSSWMHMKIYAIKLRRKAGVDFLIIMRYTYTNLYRIE